MMMKRLQTVILLCPLLAIEVRGVRGHGDTSDLVKRQTREQGYNDNIALDSSVDAVSKVAPAAIMVKIWRYWIYFIKMAFHK